MNATTAVKLALVFGLLLLGFFVSFGFLKRIAPPPATNAAPNAAPTVAQTAALGRDPNKAYNTDARAHQCQKL